MKIEDVKALPDAELAQVVAAGIEEQKARAERKKQETIARIKELAGSVGVTLTINGARGRPPKLNGQHQPAESKAVKHARQ